MGWGGVGWGVGGRDDGEGSEGGDDGDGLGCGVGGRSDAEGLGWEGGGRRMVRGFDSKIYPLLDIV